MLDIKTLEIRVSEMKIFKYSTKTDKPQGGQFEPGVIFEQTWQRSIKGTIFTCLWNLGKILYEV